MSTKIKFFKMLMIFQLYCIVAIGQSSVLELTTGNNTAPNAFTLPIVGSGFGPRTTNQVATFVEDKLNNSKFTLYNPPAGSVTATFSFSNQQFTGLTYGASTSNATTTGLVFGAGPSLSTGGSTQQVEPLNSFETIGAFNGNGGPRNEMFMSQSGVPANTLPYPAQNGFGINARGGVSAATDRNAGAQVFTTAQVLFDQTTPQPYGTNDRYYFGDLVITFSQFVSNPVIHIAGLGGAYRYLPLGAPNADTSNYLSTFFSTELELQGISNTTVMSRNEFLSVTGGSIKNNCARPNGESFFVAAPNNLTHNNFGAASGSIRINRAVKSLVFKVYLRGSDLSQFGWSSNGVGVVTNATRAPLTGDIWNISTSFEPAQLIPLPSTGVHLEGALNGNDVQLSWKTQTELNSENFEIERSIDGTNFTAIGTKAAAGNSSTQVSYDYTDRNMTSSIYYYRLKLNDIDARYSYSNIVTIRKAGGIKDIRVYPNPAVNNVSLEFNNAKGNYVIRLYNQAGQEVMNKVTNIQYNVQTIGLERGNLPAGYYMIQISNNNDGSVRSEKVIFQ